MGQSHATSQLSSMSSWSRVALPAKALSLGGGLPNVAQTALLGFLNSLISPWLMQLAVVINGA